MKIAGIIGGLGPETTSKFYLDIIFACQQQDNSNRPPLVISSVPLPYKLEKEAIIDSLGLNKILPYLIEEARRLEKAGVDFIVMPCNSLHIFIEDLRESVNIPVLSIIEKTAEFLQRRNLRRVGVVSTAITAKYRLYERELIKRGIKYLSPGNKDQELLNRIVYRLVQGKKDESMKKELIKIMKTLKGVDGIVLGCTDLQLLNPKLEGTKVFDTMKILADATVAEILEQVL